MFMFPCTVFTAGPHVILCLQNPQKLASCVEFSIHPSCSIKKHTKHIRVIM